MTIQTHQGINQECFGTPVYLEEGESRVELLTIDSMSVDETGLVHGGYIFGLADYAAMIAVNHPNVVLGSSDVKFLKPVRAGEAVIATATVEARQGRKQIVAVTVTRNDEVVFSGSFTCFVLDKHVLA
ncbi:MAG: PaaI family thioesterase [Deltaproteobacteria bacterium]|nr:PaaI family thioesterase [Deltaproteobacteria bacterium]